MNTYNCKVHCISRGEIPLLLQYFLVDELVLLSFKVKEESQTQVQILASPCAHTYMYCTCTYACLHVVDQQMVPSNT